MWSYDLVMDRTHDGRPLKMMVVMEEYNRKCVTIEVPCWLPFQGIQEVLGALFLQHRCPAYIRSNHGHELIAHTLLEWYGRLEVALLFLEPGSQWANGYVESFNGKLRDELLNGEVFYTL